MVNTFTNHFPVSSIPTDYVFDRESTPTTNGIVCETLRKRKDAIRSKHPTCSVAVIGKQAEYLIEGHNEKSEHFLPYSRLAEIDGKYLCIGIGGRLVAIRHEAQHRSGLSSVVPFYRGVKYITDERKVKLFIQQDPGCVTQLPKLVPVLRQREILKTGKIGMAQAYITSSRELIDAMAMMLKEKPVLNLCDDILCLWCRELERRMNLYSKIENARIFQKNNVITKFIVLANRIRLNRFNLLFYREGKGEFAEEIKQTRLDMASNFLNDICLTFRKNFHSRK
jgi:aminoglycoside N3'-acetyltransferase